MQDEDQSSLLVRFARLVAEATTPAEIVPLLARAAVDDFRASAAAVFEIQGDRAVLVGQAGFSKPAVGWSVDSDTIGDELGSLMATAAGKKGSCTRVWPLVSSGGLFGALLLVFSSEKRAKEARLEFAAALADLAATALQRAAQFAELKRSNVELIASRDVLARSTKLRALGEMAAGVTHDLKNILNPLSLHLQILKRAVSTENQGAQDSIKEMQSVIQRGVETLNRLREFSRQTPETKVARVDLNRVAHEAIEISKPRLHSRNDLQITLREELGAPPGVLVREGELVAVVVNLLANGIDAIAGDTKHGTVVVKTGSSGSRGLLSVEDDGPGMLPEVEQRVFEPFFTTKGANEGTGLGLAMAYAFVQRHRGTIELETQPGKGTKITIAFDAAAEDRVLTA
jgi:signal transduction histidine kinase